MDTADENDTLLPPSGLTTTTTRAAVPAEWVPAGIVSPVATARGVKYSQLHHEVSLPMVGAGSGVAAVPDGCLHEIFENQRFSRALSEWGGDYPSHLSATDRKPYTNRVGHPTAAPDACACPAGWEWVEEWHIDVAPGCDEDGWGYGLSFEQLDRSFLVGEDDFGGAVSGSIEVRQRRWVRTRRRSAFRGGAPPPNRQLGALPQAQVLGGRWGSDLPDAAVLREGFLCCQRAAEGSGLAVYYTLLLAEPPDEGAALVFCESSESLRVRHSLAHGLVTERVSLTTPRRPAAWDPRCCFQVGAGPDKLLLRALSPAVCESWIAALATVRPASLMAPPRQLGAAGPSVDVSRWNPPLVPGQLRVVA